MPYRTEHGSHYHEEYGCHGATIPCDASGFAPCSDCCGARGNGTGKSDGDGTGVPSGGGATSGTFESEPATWDTPRSSSSPSPVSDEASQGESQVADIMQGEEAVGIGSEALTDGGLSMPGGEVVSQQDIEGHLAQATEDPVSLTPEEEFQRQWKRTYDMAVGKSSERAYGYCMATVEETGEFPDFDGAFDYVLYSLQDMRMKWGTEWMLGTGFGLGYARAIVECKDACDVREAIRGLSDYLQADAKSELAELGLG